MTPGQQKRKDRQDEARRLQQADEKIRELEAENDRLRSVLQSIARAPHPVRSANRSQLLSDIKNTAKSALDGGGDSQ